MERFCPPWLKPLITAKFFEECPNHIPSECNLFCLECMSDPMCFSCTIGHKSHHIVQIRRSSYHDAIRVNEIQKAIDLSGVQTYIINSAKIVFLNGRPQQKLAKGVTKTCEICERSLNENFRYCSLGCKLEGIKKHNDMTFILQPKDQQQQNRISNVRRVYPEDGTSSSSSRKSSRIRKLSTRLSLTTSSIMKVTTSLENSSSEEEGAAAAKSQKMSSIVKDETSKEAAKQDQTSCLDKGSSSGLDKVKNSSSQEEVDNNRSSKRRKGTPHRSQLGTVIL